MTKYFHNGLKEQFFKYENDKYYYLSFITNTWHVHTRIEIHYIEISLDDIPKSVKTLYNNCSEFHKCIKDEFYKDVLK